jgi:hypothetical protein
MKLDDIQNVLEYLEIEPSFANVAKYVERNSVMYISLEIIEYLTLNTDTDSKA